MHLEGLATAPGPNETLPNSVTPASYKLFSRVTSMLSVQPLSDEMSRASAFAPSTWQWFPDTSKRSRPM